jgi:hypothetical protein
MADKYATFKADGTLNHRLIKGLHVIPEGATRVDEKLWSQLIQETDCIWLLGADGGITARPLPVVEDNLPLIERQWRNGEIDSIRWLRERHRDEVEIGKATSISEAQFEELMIYIQKLRDWPVSQYFPDKGKRPGKPVWIDSQTG